MWFIADNIISSLKKDLLFAHDIDVYYSNVKKYESRANVGIWTRDLFLTKETLYPWATSAVQVVWLDLVERETGFEPATFSLEGWRSTNWATPALLCGESRIRTCEGKNQQIYSLSSLAAWVSPQNVNDLL